MKQYMTPKFSILELISTDVIAASEPFEQMDIGSDIDIDKVPW